MSVTGLALVVLFLPLLACALLAMKKYDDGNASQVPSEAPACIDDLPAAPAFPAALTFAEPVARTQTRRPVPIARTTAPAFGS